MRLRPAAGGERATCPALPAMPPLPIPLPCPHPCPGAAGSHSVQRYLRQRPTEQIRGCLSSPSASLPPAQGKNLEQISDFLVTAEDFGHTMDKMRTRSRALQLGSSDLVAQGPWCAVCLHTLGAERERDRQTDRQTDRPTDKQRETPPLWQTECVCTPVGPVMSTFPRLP